MGVAAAAVVVVGGVAQMIIAAKQAKKAREAEERYNRQELTNVYSGLSVSTAGSDLQREELARATATGVEALQKAGSREVVAGMGRLQAGNIQQSRQIGADLDRQQKEIDRLRARDEARIQRGIERREEADLAGIGREGQVAQQNLMGGIKTVGQGIAGFGSNIDYGGRTPQVEGVSTITSEGIALMGGMGEIEVETMPAGYN